MDTLRNVDEYDVDDSECLTFQCLHWNGDNQFIEDQYHSTDKRTKYNLEHVIKIYGV